MESSNEQDVDTPSHFRENKDDNHSNRRSNRIWTRRTLVLGNDEMVNLPVEEDVG